MIKGFGWDLRIGKPMISIDEVVYGFDSINALEL